MRLRRRKDETPAQPAPRHMATIEDMKALLEERRRQLRLADQERFNSDGLPRYIER